MVTPVVIQGKPVTQQQAFGSALTGVNNEPNHHSNYTTNYNTNQTTTANRDDKVETSCNDPIFAVLFIIAVVAIVGIAATYGVDALSASNNSNGGNSSSSDDYSGYLVITAVIVVISFFGAGGGMAVLFCIPQFLIKVALLFTVVMSFLWMALSFATGNIVGGILGLIFFALSACYAYMVWSRIPFATANLITAMTAVRANLGVAVYAYFFAILGGVWAFVWTLSFVGLFNKTYSCDANNECKDPSYGILFVLFLAFFFVQQVLQVR
jgi:Plasma-membrane choline transporter